MGRRDHVDVACEQWAEVMRELLGLTQPRLASQYVGALRCTLAARRDLHHGSRSGKVEQHWPEFPFAGHAEAQIVHAVYRRLPEALAEILVAHYVVTAPRNRTTRAELMGLTRRTYFDRVGRAKSAVEGGLAVVEIVRTHLPPDRGIRRMSETPPA